ncbi:MAG: hypothetical protein GY832_25415 [Chloroflexi bacterium]|nr:hypothetical protein [Chloroflexota bacterium]
MTKRISLFILFTTSLIIVFYAIFAVTIGMVSASGVERSLCVDHTEKAEKDSFLKRSLARGKEATTEQINGTYRGLWIWNTDIVIDSDAQHEFFIFAQLKNVSGAYLYAYSLLPNNSDELEDFIARGSNINIEVELLAGDPTWALTPTHPVALGFVQRTITFTKSITESARPIGIHLDIEPYLLPEWNSDRSSIITQYLDLLSDVKQELVASSINMTFSVDIPFWYDTITATYTSVTKPLNQHVQDITDRIVIMDYRDFAEGNDGIIYHAQDEMDYAQGIGKEIIIGVETNDIEPEKITFFEEGETVMENELAFVKQHYQTSSAFRGLAIHDYSGYYALAPIRIIHLPIVLKNSLAN